MPDTPAYRVLIDAISRLSRVQRELGTELARELDCPRTSMSLLWLLDKQGPMGIGDIAQHLHVDISVASRQAGALVDAGLAERSTPDAPGTDRRVRTVGLTAAGRRLTGDTKAALDTRASTLFAGWTREELTDAATQVERIADAIAHRVPLGLARVAADAPGPVDGPTGEAPSAPALAVAAT